MWTATVNTLNTSRVVVMRPHGMPCQQHDGMMSSLLACVCSLSMPRKALVSYFQTKHDYDVLAARSIWAFGPTRCVTPPAL